MVYRFRFPGDAVEEAVSVSPFGFSASAPPPDEECQGRTEAGRGQHPLLVGGRRG